MKMHKDIIDYIYKLIHLSNTHNLVYEYKHLLNDCNIVYDDCDVCEHSYGFRLGIWSRFQVNFRKKDWRVAIYNIHSHTTISALPKNYYTYFLK